MSVSDHLHVDPDAYDARIRTYVPHYEDLVTGVADALEALDTSDPDIVDLGAGTGALAARCLERWPGARVVGIDADPEMLRVAEARLGAREGVRFVAADFESAEIPGCDALVACLSLHHVPTPGAKRALYAKCGRALRPGGLLVSGDRFTATDPFLRGREREAWLDHLEGHYTREEAEGHLAAWAEEDVYFALREEMGWLEEAGLAPDVTWCRDGFAVLVGRRRRSEG